MASDNEKSNIPKYLSAALLVLMVGSYFVFPSYQEFLDNAWKVLTSGDNQRIEKWVSGFGWIGPVVLILAMVLQMFLLIIPTIALMVVSVLAYGPIWGSLIIFVSVYAASSVGYWIGRYFGEGLVARLIGKNSEKKISDFIGDYGFWAVFVVRLNPFLSNDAISFVGGILGMGYWKFIGATLAGIAPLTIFIAIMGKSNDSLKNGLLWGSLVSLVLFLAYYYWDKRLRKDNH